MKKIVLDEKELDFISKLEKLPELFKSKLKEMSNILNTPKLCLQFSDNDADMIRDFFLDQHQAVGFDIEYNLTNEGKLLESLIDKFFVG